jgi:hypothetical protein
MPASESELFVHINRKFAAVNTSMEAIEQQLYEASETKRINYIKATNQQRYSLFRWFRKFKTPKLRRPFWNKLDMIIELRAALDAPHPSRDAVLPILNLFLLNTAIELVRMQAKGEIVRQLTELQELMGALREQARA